jgi:hypothetical protein
LFFGNYYFGFLFFTSYVLVGLAHIFSFVVVCQNARNNTRHYRGTA